MNTRPNVQPRPYVNGLGRQKVSRDMGRRLETQSLYGISASSDLGSVTGAQLGGYASPLHDRLIYVMAHLKGHRVEVQVKNGSVISGVFHATLANRDLEIILKMAVVIKDGSSRWPSSVVDIVKEPQTMIIPGREFVQLVAKDLELSHEESRSARACDKRKDLMIDSVISHSYHVEVERELEPWMPDEDDLDCPELENTFDGTWNRKWDQFQTNEALFGVKSTFNEELYTTKLERGPRMIELEQQAIRIAREIEREETEDPHLAEERGMHLDRDFDLDEESRYSAVRRKVDDRRFAEAENSDLDVYSSETFTESLGPATTFRYLETSRKVVNNEARVSSGDSSLDEDASLGILSDKDVYLPSSIDDCGSTENSSLSLDDKSRLDERQSKDHAKEKSFSNESRERMAYQESLASKFDDIHTSTNFTGLSPSAVAYDPSPSRQVNRSSQHTDSVLSYKMASEHVNASVRPSSSTSSTSEQAGPASGLCGPGLSPSSSFGSLSSEKSTLNPKAKEFKLNPNAKSFTPTASLRSHPPVSSGALYYASNITLPHMHGVSSGMEVDPSFGNQPVIYGPQAAWQSPQPYIHASGPLYGQQILGQGQPVYYLPTYQPEMPYKGRNF